MFRKDYDPRELQLIPMMRLTAYISGRVQRVGFRAKAVALATKMGLVGMVQNRPDDGIEILKQNDLKTYMDMRFERIETDLAELKELKTALKEKGFI